MRPNTTVEQTIRVNNGVPSGISKYDYTIREGNEKINFRMLK